MKTEYKYIQFTFTDSNDPKKGGSCVHKQSKDTLGYWDYYKPWKQYVIEFLEDGVFNTTCLKDIVDFLSQLNGTKTMSGKWKPKYKVWCCRCGWTGIRAFICYPCPKCGYYYPKKVKGKGDER